MLIELWFKIFSVLFVTLQQAPGSLTSPGGAASPGGGPQPQQQHSPQQQPQQVATQQQGGQQQQQQTGQTQQAQQQPQQQAQQQGGGQPQQPGGAPPQQGAQQGQQPPQQGSGGGGQQGAMGQQHLGCPTSGPNCIRTGCTNPAVHNPEWEDEYCSNECVVSHCRLASRHTHCFVWIYPYIGCILHFLWIAASILYTKIHMKDFSRRKSNFRTSLGYV